MTCFPAPFGSEIKLVNRPTLGRIEHSRFASKFAILDQLAEPMFFSRINRQIHKIRPDYIHAIAHDMSFWPAFQSACSLKLPYHLTIHDDLFMYRQDPYSLRVLPGRLAAVWQDAAERYVISAELGNEYSRRYGVKPFHVVTDGLTELATEPRSLRPENRLRIYFMGLFQISYTDNMQCLSDAIRLLHQQNPNYDIELICRSGVLSPRLNIDQVRVTILPQTLDEALVFRECIEADLLYLPLPFAPEFSSFARFSLSTKLISYLASGSPILYHGPEQSAAGTLVEQNQVAVSCYSLKAAELAQFLDGFIRGSLKLDPARSLDLCRARFMAEDQRRIFWQSIITTPVQEDRSVD